MKKLLVGCLGVFVVLLLLGGGATYWFVWRPLQNAGQSLQQLEQISVLNQEVRNTGGFTAPADGVLTEAQLNRYLAVQNQMKASLESTLAELNVKYQDFDGDEISLQNIRQFFGSYKDIIDLVIDAKEIQVQALNEQGFSLKEYAWVKRETFRAAALPFTTLDLSELSGELNLDLPEITNDIPQANIDLLAPHRENLEDVIGLAFFGL